MGDIVKYVILSILALLFLYYLMTVVISSFIVYLRIRRQKDLRILYVNPWFFFTRGLKRKTPDLVLTDGKHVILLKQFSVGIHSRMVFTHSSQWMVHRTFPFMKQPRISKTKSMAYSQKRMAKVLNTEFNVPVDQVKSIYLFFPKGNGLAKHEAKGVKPIGEANYAFGSFMLHLKTLFGQLAAEEDDQIEKTVEVDKAKLKAYFKTLQ